LLDHALRVRQQRRRSAFVDRGDTDEISWVWNPTAYKAFLGMLTGLENPEACFLSEIKAFIEHRGYNDLRHAAEGGHDVAAYLYAILLYRDNGGAAADDTAKGYMRRVTGGGNTTSSRWLSNEGCLPLREKAAHALHYSTWRIWGEPLPLPAQVRGD
jgi:hypothetical protein